MVDNRPDYSRLKTGKVPVVVSPTPPKDTNVLWVQETKIAGKPVQEVKQFTNGEWSTVYETAVGDFNADFNKDFCY